MIRAASLLAISLLLMPARAADWPEFLGPNRDATSPETGLVDAIPSGGLPIVWSKEVGAGYSAPSIRGKLLVMHHRVGDEEIVEAMDPATGKSKWRYAYPSKFTDPFGYNNGPRCSPLLTQDRCYTFGAEGVLVCLDLKTGKLIWRRDTAKDFNLPEAFFGVGSSPIIVDDETLGERLIVHLGANPDAGVVAFDAKTGRTMWTNVGEASWTNVPMTGWPGERLIRWNPADPAFDKQASYCTPVLATIHGRRLILCVTRQGLVALDAVSGQVKFSFWFRARQDSSVNAMTPVVVDDLIFLSSAYFKNGSVVLRVRPGGDGVDEVWRSTVLEMHWARPIYTDGHLFAFTGRNEPDARFRCVELKTGTLKWDRPEGWPNGGHARVSPGDEPKVFGRGSAILADGKIFAIGEAGLLGLFRPNTSQLEELGRWQVPGLYYPVWAGPVLAERRLYLRCDDRLVCLNVAP
jgi:outer membrane protein assembly factor BamB